MAGLAEGGGEDLKKRKRCVSEDESLRYLPGVWTLAPPSIRGTVTPGATTWKEESESDQGRPAARSRQPEEELERAREAKARAASVSRRRRRRGEIERRARDVERPRRLERVATRVGKR